MVMQTQETLSDKYIRILRDGFVSMDMAQNILVIKTVSGMALSLIHIFSLMWELQSSMQ